LYIVLLLTAGRADIPGHGDEEREIIQNMLGLPIAIPFSLLIISSILGTVLAIILVASCIGSEYNWRTIRTMMISSESRFKLLWAKLIASSIFILVGMIITVIAGFIMSLITTAIGGYAFDFGFMDGEYIWDQFAQFWRTFFVLIPYALVGFLMAIVGRSVLPGIALGIGIYFIESLISNFLRLAGGWVEEIPNYLLAANARAINMMADLPQSFIRMGGDITFQLPGTTHAFVTLTIYCLAFLVIAFYLFRRRDVTG
jgi:ABC-type transport system involved in multi-copper enzyme maturation permease subunit